MFTREKHCKNNQALNHSGISKNNISSNKFSQRTYPKNKNQIIKKNKCDRLWKKQSFNIFWTDKENDKNNSNYNYNKKFYYDGKRKAFRYQKKLSHTELNSINDFTEEKINNINNENKNKNEKDIKYKKYENDSKEEISKDEKNNSIEYTTTTAYSNSISTHEESNNNIININDNLNINELKLSSKDSNSSNSSFILMNKFYINNSLNNQFFQKTNSNEEIKQKKNLDELNDINNNFFSNSMKNLNFIRLNSCPNHISEFSSISKDKIPKIQNINKLPDNYSSEPYNKYNSINQELNQLWINPIAENTEILNVNVKISKNKNVVFKLRRFDDLFLTVKLFCEINLIDEKFMKPIIIKTLCTLNNIYQIFNTQIDEKNIQRLKLMNTFNKNTCI